MDPRVAVTKAIPSAHSRSSSVATGASSACERRRPQYWFCEVSAPDTGKARLFTADSCTPD
jgi:hypothetical protein